MEQSVNTYNYSPLNAELRHIRLISLRPGAFKDPIQCRLMHVLLDESPEYEALSYVWGNPQVTRLVRIEREAFQLTANLESALRYIRLADRPRKLWVDAICINQKDKSERNNQVSLMKEVYHAASSVIVWLGVEDLDTEVAFKWVATLAPQLRETKQSIDLGGRNSSWARSVFVDLLRREWWYRRWVIQEATVGRDVMVVCGYQCAKWEDFGTVITWFAKEFENDVFNRIKAFFSYDESGLYDLLRRYRFCKSTEAVDTVYAILGLASDIKKESFVIDYSLSAREVFCKMATDWIRQNSSLDIFGDCENTYHSLATNPRDKDRVPSWAPDWSVPLLNTTFRKHRTADREGQSLSVPMYSASAGTPPVLIDIDDRSLICLRGFTITTISQVSTSNMNWDDSWCIPDTGFFISAPDSSVFLFNESVEDKMGDRIAPSMKKCAFARILIADMLSNRRAPESIAKVYDCWRRKKEKSPREQGLAEDELLSALAYDLSVSAATSERRLFVSLDQRMGLVPNAAREGDVICVLFGGQMPLVLRPKREFFELIGEAYVYGIMDGEAMQDLEAGKYHEQDFVLQ